MCQSCSCPLCVPLSLLHWATLCTISMQKNSKWHSQQVALTPNFNQLYRWRVPFRLDRCEFLFFFFTLLIKSAVWAEPHIHLTLHVAAGWLSAVMTALHEKRKRSAPLSKRRLIKTSSGRKWWPAKEFICERLCCRSRSSRDGRWCQWLPLCVCERRRCAVA